MVSESAKTATASAKPEFEVGSLEWARAQEWWDTSGINYEWVKDALRKKYPTWTGDATLDGVEGKLTISKQALLFNGQAKSQGCDIQNIRMLNMPDQYTLVAHYSVGGELKTMKLGVKPETFGLEGPVDAVNVTGLNMYTWPAYWLAMWVRWFGQETGMEVPVIRKKSVVDSEFAENIKKAREKIPHVRNFDDGFEVAVLTYRTTGGVPEGVFSMSQYLIAALVSVAESAHQDALRPDEAYGPIYKEAKLKRRIRAFEMAKRRERKFLELCGL